MQTAKTTKSTKPTASQILAAKKDKKEIRNIKLMGRTLKRDRNATSANHQIQQSNIREMLASPKMDAETAVDCSIMMWLNLQDMHYACNQELINFAEHICKQVQRLGIYCNMDDHENDQTVMFACREASQAVEKWENEFDDLSPNQRRIVLRPLAALFAAYDEFLQDGAPSRLVSESSTYCLAVRVVKRAVKFLTLEGKLITAIGNIVNGKDSRHEARLLKMPYAEFSDRVLHAANLLYDVGMQADKSIEAKYGKPLNPIRPVKMGDVRQPMLKMLVQNGWQMLIEAIRDSERLIRHCDNATGFSCFNWTEHYRKISKMQLAIKKEAAA